MRGRASEIHLEAAKSSKSRRSLHRPYCSETAPIGHTVHQGKPPWKKIVFTLSECLQAKVIKSFELHLGISYDFFVFLEGLRKREKKGESPSRFAARPSALQRPAIGPPESRAPLFRSHPIARTFARKRTSRQRRQAGVADEKCGREKCHFNV